MIDSRDCECERWRDGATVCPMHPDSTKPAGWDATPGQAAKKATKKIRKLRAVIEERDREIFALTGRVRRLAKQIEDMETHWRPVPIVHEWQPRDPQCRLCDEPRDAARHQTPSPADEQR